MQTHKLGINKARGMLTETPVRAAADRRQNEWMRMIRDSRMNHYYFFLTGSLLLLLWLLTFLFSSFLLTSLSCFFSSRTIANHKLKLDSALVIDDYYT